MPVCWPSQVVKYRLQCHPRQFFIQTKCPFPPLDPGTALRHGCGQEGASINAFPKLLHLLGPFLCQGQREFTKEAKCFYLPVAMWSLTSPMGAIQMPLLLGDTWWSSGRPLGGCLPAQPRLLGNQLHWACSSLPQLPPSYNPPYRLAAGVSSLSGSQFRVGLYYNNWRLQWCPPDLQEDLCVCFPAR